MSDAADISSCGQYRYTLRRDLPSANKELKQILWVMLNPSTADATNDDPTIRRCVGFSTAWGFAEMVVVNLYAYRATDPKVLWSIPDPVGPDNDDYIREYSMCSDMTLCAWGKPGPARGRASRVRGLIPNAHYLRMNKSGHPGHPLYLPKELTPKEWA